MPASIPGPEYLILAGGGVTALVKIAKIAGLAVVVWSWVWARDAQWPATWSWAAIRGAPLCTLPLAVAGRRALDARPSADRVKWVTILVHYGTMMGLGIAIFRAFRVVLEWPGTMVPVPRFLASVLVGVTSVATLLTVVNLALRGLGAPFVVKLSSRLATDWMYAWTRNPMLLCTLVWLFSFGLYYQSTWFLVWMAVSVAPGWIFLVKVYEERELRIRFGAGYEEYRARTPFLWPRRPRPAKKASSATC